ncbi:Transposase [Desulfosporosinus sp. I2]|uniref:tyrosine-type recombinase/integrase n=1 Tax=Desulfosporosinus sp. I2 TaxID=1617025 RepID=UPI0005EEA7FD|nr:tyrosine-type recombinase/integrase [Desulfosporosinus sp. I2]KJR45153.1 Transposase [Desulfosporosinus sp. I2]
MSNNLANQANTIKMDLGGQSIDEYEQILKTYSTFSRFYDSKWILDKRYTGRNVRVSNHQFIFAPYHSRDVMTVKAYVLNLLVSNYSSASILGRLYAIKQLLRFCQSHNCVFAMRDLQSSIAPMYYHYIMNSQLDEQTKARVLKNLMLYLKYANLVELHDALERQDIPDESRYHNGNKLVPQNVIEQLDTLFLNDNIPIEYQCIYWILRLIPNRITEVLSMKIDCLTDIGHRRYMLCIPTFKQSGQYYRGEFKGIIIEYSGIAKGLIDTIREQIAIAQSLQAEAKGADQGFLFIHRPKMYHRKLDSFFEQNRPLTLIKYDVFNAWIQRHCLRKGIVDISGQPYTLSSHQFRHNAITERLNSGFFNLLEICYLLGHKNVTMPYQAYWHYSNERRIEKGKLLREQISGEESLNFKGKIIKTSQTRVWTGILSKPFSHQIGNIGICSDISNCNVKVFDCLECVNFTPNAEDLPYFQNQLNEWEKKLNTAKSVKYNFLIETAQKQIRANQRVIEKITSERKRSHL